MTDIREEFARKAESRRKPPISGSNIGYNCALDEMVAILRATDVPDTTGLVDRFLAWPLPDSVCSDMCATVRGYPNRVGTNLLTADEARQLIEYLFPSPPPEVPDVMISIVRDLAAEMRGFACNMRRDDSDARDCMRAPYAEALDGFADRINEITARKRD